MARFKIVTPVPGWEGNVGERETGVAVTRFVDGAAEVDVTDQGTASRLAYFRSAGYIVQPLDDISAEVAIRSAVLTVGQEVDALEAENAELRKVSEVDKLRAENAKLRAQVEGRSDTLSRDDTEDTRPKTFVGESGPEVTVRGPQVAPADSAPVDEWRAYGVARLGLSESEAKGWDKRGLQRREQERQAAEALEKGDA